MNFLAWLLALTIMVTVMIKAVDFHNASICRQKAWLKGTELQTGTLLYRPKDFAQSGDIGCKLYVVRRKQKVSWRLLPNLKQHAFNLPLTGKI
ncbi:MAG: hypothetical protein H0V66_05715 [Bdellovibrionales bacterium]|nr:hypothetical protein [Bdellovibrionales bacterium]